MPEPLGCDIEIVKRSRRDSDRLVCWAEVTVNGMQMPATGEPRIVHTRQGTCIGLDLAVPQGSTRHVGGGRWGGGTRPRSDLDLVTRAPPACPQCGPSGFRRFSSSVMIR
ncbi:hypothetical protein [Nocardia sp. NPDC046763]|uniref:hypothetical protein n=1 Tax=Nocardia sp. NPDC046763 TaxID=3155256 RepID=UPI0033F3ABBF